jgi:protein TonB
VVLSVALHGLAAYAAGLIASFGRYETSRLVELRLLSNKEAPRESLHRVGSLGPSGARLKPKRARLGPRPTFLGGRSQAALTKLSIEQKASKPLVRGLPSGPALSRDNPPTKQPVAGKPSVHPLSAPSSRGHPSANERARRLEAIRQQIQEALVYPSAARRFGWEGKARVRLLLSPEGKPLRIDLVASSHVALLDKEALDAVRRAAPYPYVEGPIVVPIVFDLKADR